MRKILCIIHSIKIIHKYMYSVNLDQPADLCLHGFQKIE